MVGIIFIFYQSLSSDYKSFLCGARRELWKHQKKYKFQKITNFKLVVITEAKRERERDKVQAISTRATKQNLEELLVL